MWIGSDLVELRDEVMAVAAHTRTQGVDTDAEFSEVAHRAGLCEMELRDLYQWTRADMMTRSERCGLLAAYLSGLCERWGLLCGECGDKTEQGKACDRCGE